MHSNWSYPLLWTVSGLDHGQDECLGVDGLDVSRGSCVYTEVVIPLYSEFGNRLEGPCSSGAFHWRLCTSHTFQE